MFYDRRDFFGYFFLEKSDKSKKYPFVTSLEEVTKNRDLMKIMAKFLASLLKIIWRCRLR